MLHAAILERVKMELKEGDLLVPLLSGFTPTPYKFALYELLQSHFWKTWIATVFFSYFKSIYFHHIKTSQSHRFLSNWLTAYYIREIFASNWLSSSSMKQNVCLYVMEVFVMLTAGNSSLLDLVWVLDTLC